MDKNIDKHFKKSEVLHSGVIEKLGMLLPVWKKYLILQYWNCNMIECDQEFNLLNTDFQIVETSCKNYKAWKINTSSQNTTRHDGYIIKKDGIMNFISYIPKSPNEVKEVLNRLFTDITKE